MLKPKPTPTPTPKPKSKPKPSFIIVWTLPATGIRQTKCGVVQKPDQLDGKVRVPEPEPSLSDTLAAGGQPASPLQRASEPKKNNRRPGELGV
ncbi:hypothetical protein JCM24511_02452 [Saitozyma sp. JCM 24511]|nr:hypothetical protein JCM24511_02452 [Saitozyma sp. JCM 24511]